MASVCKMFTSVISGLITSSKQCCFVYAVRSAEFQHGVTASCGGERTLNSFITRVT